MLVRIVKNESKSDAYPANIAIKISAQQLDKVGNRV